MSAQSITRRKFTRIPKMEELIDCGVPLRAIPTYLVLSDHAANKSGKTHVSINSIARALKVCRRTVERHLVALEGAGVIKRQSQRRGRGGRFSSCVCFVISFALFAVRHTETGGPHRERSRTKLFRTTPLNPPEGDKERQRRKEAERRREGYEWLFDG